MAEHVMALTGGAVSSARNLSGLDESNAIVDTISTIDFGNAT